MRPRSHRCCWSNGNLTAISSEWSCSRERFSSSCDESARECSVTARHRWPSSSRSEYESRLKLEGAAGLKPFRIGLDCVQTLEEQGLSLRSVPPANTSVTVMTATNFGGAQDSEAIASPFSPTLEAEVVRAADVLGVRLAGVDLITSDPSRSLSSSAGAILDVGPAPALHNLGDAATAIPVLVAILRALLADARVTSVAAHESELPSA